MVIFDFDGVVVDSEPLTNALLARMLSELGLAISQDEAMRRFTGRRNVDCLADIERDFEISLPADFAENFRAGQWQIYREQVQAIPGIVELVAALRGPFCIASGSDQEKIRCGLGRVGLIDAFGERIFSAAQVARGKPHPDLFLHAARSLGVAVEQCVVVEDSLIGVSAGRAAGMPVFGLVGAFSAEDLRAAGAQPVLDLQQLRGEAAFRRAAGWMTPPEVTQGVLA